MQALLWVDGDTVKMTKNAQNSWKLTVNYTAVAGQTGDVDVKVRFNGRKYVRVPFIGRTGDFYPSLPHMDERDHHTKNYHGVLRLHHSLEFHLERL